MASSSLAKEKKNTQKKKTIEKKIYAEKGGNLPSSSHFALLLLAPTSVVKLLNFCFKCFVVASSSSQA
jgi:hypothetical protein